MSAARKLDALIIPAIDVFRERCEARAILVEACVYDLQEAVDGLQQAAVESGLVEVEVKHGMHDPAARPPAHQ